ncbi:serine--tRNA synthetase-like protein Slimp [Sitodiplosis mosellana]|uniref:serine--tRNA synthetase-like protein Slimp n=1 Tax=Sitodiplosis mosellana TaxID=263140 RepID=UPI002444104B|nr:serine--tRNA synthetase-like protein Slimp [Sitodiplosis mosellana]
MFLKAQSLVFVPCRFVQALFVSHRNAKGNVRALWPILDHKNCLENRRELEDNVKRRGFGDQVNIVKLYDQWEQYKEAESRKVAIEKRRAQLSKLIVKAKSENTDSQNSIEDLLQEARGLRGEYQSACERFYEIDEVFNNNFLDLPNKLLSTTPDEPQIVFSHGLNSAENHTSHHLDYKHMIEYINETCYYLQKEAAHFDRALPNTLIDQFQRNGFSQLSNPDFAKTVTVEGGGTALQDLYEIQHDYNEKCSNLLHLVGSGSWLSFLGFVAKTKIEKELLPMQFISTGKIYRPNNTNDRGLFDVVQSTAVQMFLAGTESQMAEKFDTVLELIIQIFKTIDIHFRVIHVPASQLHSTECFATQIEMYSPSLQQYIEIGRLSQYGDFISKRLRFQCQRDETNTQYKPHIIGGTVCNVTKCLAIILETHNGIIPNAVVTENFVK